MENCRKDTDKISLKKGKYLPYHETVLNLSEKLFPFDFFSCLTAI